jgi:hypothetical protein
VHLAKAASASKAATSASKPAATPSASRAAAATSSSAPFDARSDPHHRAVLEDQPLVRVDRRRRRLLEEVEELESI